MSANRNVIQQMEFLAKKYPVLALTGPRQSGKTTLLKNHFSDYTYVSLENLDNRSFAQKDPNGFLKQYSEFVILDEVQRVPQLFSYLQTKVDEDMIMGQYILSGSQNFHLMHNITQSLAGRVALFKLLPFDCEEMEAAGWLDGDYAVNVQRGSYPAVYDRDIPVNTFFSNYVQTYVERDLSEIINVKDLKQFRNFISLCAGRAGQLLNLNALANACGVSQPTAKSWILVLEASYVIYLLQPYHGNFNKRITKSPKLYFYDTGLLCYLLKIRDAESLKISQHKGSCFENYVINEYMKQNHHHNLHCDFWFWRDAAGHEVDLIWQHTEKINIVEIKASETIMSDMFKGLNYFEALKPDLIDSKTLVHTGNFNQERSDASVKSWRAIKLEV
ncbi:MAG: ATP-binding protein [Cryomorphaceae bacterium]|nr:ATP-binding protein [Cryomorphaceae bacterium]